MLEIVGVVALSFLSLCIGVLCLSMAWAIYTRQI